MLQYLNKIPSWLKNKYSIATILFLLFILFLDDNNIFNQYKLYKEKAKLEAISANYKVKIAALQKDNNALEKNPLAIEKIAREKYGMKRPDETVFVLP